MNKNICPECGTNVNDEMDACSNCGFPLKESSNTIQSHKEINSIGYNPTLKLMLGILFIVLTIINAISTLDTIGWFFKSLFDYYGLFSIYTLTYFIEVGAFASLTIGCIGLTMLFLSKNKNSLIKQSPALISIGYVVMGIVSILTLFTWTNIGAFFNFFICLGVAILWLFSGSKFDFNFKSKESKKKFLYIMGIVVYLVRFLNGIITKFDTYYLVIPIIFIIIEFITYIIFITTIMQENTITLSHKSNINIETEPNINTCLNNNSALEKQKFNDLTESYGYVPIWQLIVFSLFTCGIYTYIWIYQSVGFFNQKRIGEEKSQGVQVLLCMFVPFYIIYWLYKQSKLTEEYTLKVNNHSNDLSVISLILSIFGLSLIAAALIQDQINKNILKESNPHEFVETSRYYESGQSNNSTQNNSNDRISENDIEYLKKLKELYDLGILTEEEYNSKKESVLKSMRV